MCGITGCWHISSIKADILKDIIESMNRTLLHRGPDDGGVWLDASQGVALANRRLAILDLSFSGHQPMHSQNRRYVMVYNGEVYNFSALRDELQKEGYTFSSNTDTEVVLEAWASWGHERTLSRLNGMFAMAIWDCQKRSLTLVRDRIGIKPLYYGYQNKIFFFGSELKAIRAHPDFVPEVDRNSLALFLRYGYIPAPYSIYKGIYKLLPGHILFVQNNLKWVSTPYWSLQQQIEQGLNQCFQGTFQEAKEELEEVLQDAVKLRMIADVPVGAFLSGGLDSSTLVALMQQCVSSNVKTFSIGFYEKEYNEANYAKKIAEHLKTEHTELYIPGEQIQKVIPKLVEIYDEPFADSSQLPTFLVSQLARQQVVVSLSGDGGDELFAGYPRYFLGHKLSRWILSIPKPLRSYIAKMIQAIPPQKWDIFFSLIYFFLPKSFHVLRPGERIHKLSTILPIESLETLYQHLISHWKNPNQIVIAGIEPLDAFPSGGLFLKEEIHRMMLTDFLIYLPDDLLTKIDRASMAVSLEARVPFLDHRVVEFAWKLPLHWKVQHGKTKWILRQILYQYLPPHLVDRPKMGFGVPIDSWLRGPLREWTQELLSPTRLDKEGYFHSQPIQEKWKEHLNHRSNWHYLLWNILIFQLWKERWL